MNTVTPEDVGVSSTRLNRIHTVMQGYVDQHFVAGFTTMLARHGKVFHFECFGRMDMAANKPIQPDTIFRIYSMTKPITTVAMMCFTRRASSNSMIPSQTSFLSLRTSWHCSWLYP